MITDVTDNSRKISEHYVIVMRFSVQEYAIAENTGTILYLFYQ